MLDLNPILQLPALQTLEIKRYLHFQLPRGTELQPCGLLNLSVKHLKDPIMSPQQLFPLLRACKILNRCTLFVIGENGAGAWGDGNYMFNILESLYRSRRSLQELELKIPTQFSPATVHWTNTLLSTEILSSYNYQP